MFVYMHNSFLCCMPVCACKVKAPREPCLITRTTVFYATCLFVYVNSWIPGNHVCLHDINPLCYMVVWVCRIRVPREPCLFPWTSVIYSTCLFGHLNSTFRENHVCWHHISLLCYMTVFACKVKDPWETCLFTCTTSSMQHVCLCMYTQRSLGTMSVYTHCSLLCHMAVYACILKDPWEPCLFTCT